MGFKRIISLGLVSLTMFCASHSYDLYEDDITNSLLLSQDPFKLFVDHYGKNYSENEFHKRRIIFLDNLNYIRNQNSRKNLSYELGVNHITDLTFEEFQSKYTSEIPQSDVKPDILVDVSLTDRIALRAASLDHRTSGCVSPVIDQGMCSSCWAFSAAEPLTHLYCKSRGSLVPLSVQQLVDCSRSNGNGGCRGGRMDAAFSYVRASGGLCSSREYPYTGRDGSCRSCKKLMSVSQYGKVATRNENAMANAAEKYGLLSVAIRSASRDLQLYKRGVFDGQCGAQLDHAVVIVGYGNESGKDYWIVKNTWGAAWGDSGYIKLRRNVNKCGVAEDVVFPVGSPLSFPLPVVGDDSAFERDYGKGGEQFEYDVAGPIIFSNIGGSEEIDDDNSDADYVLTK